MSLQNHIEIILAKANASCARDNEVVGRIRTIQNRMQNEGLSPKQEESIEEQLTVIGNEYDARENSNTVIDGAVSQIDDILS